MAEICCPVDHCPRILSCVSELEEHYRQVHSFQCAECHSKFITSRALEVHIEEEHSPFFAAQLGLYPDRALFECFATPHCSGRFVSKERRDNHCRQEHLLENSGRVREDALKIVVDLEKSLQSVEISNHGDGPHFGDEQERMFDRRRRKLTAKRTLK